MTMFSAEKRRFCGGGYGGEGFVFVQAGYGFQSVGSDLVGGMTTDDNDNDHDHDHDNEIRTDSFNDGAESSSREEEWLQLSIGGGGRGRQEDLGTSTKNIINGSGSGLVELELMPSSSTTTHSQIRPEFRPPRPITNFGPSFFLQHPTSSNFASPHQEINWEFRPIPISLAAPPSSPPSYFPRPFQIYDVAPPAAVDFRLIPPPRRPHSGLWFMLQASHNQEKEPFLPQISKSYLRIKDGRMTIRLVIKYLVNKLSLENESEIEIRCKGQRLLPFLTLQHVRDNIWSNPRDFITLLPNSSTTHHIMVLHYARTHPSN